jgi:hypothetical protein
MTAYRGLEVNSQVQAPATLLPGTDTGTHREGRWVRPSASLDVKKRKVSCLLQGIESQFLGFVGQSLVTTPTAPPHLLQPVRSIKCVKQIVLDN